MSREPVQITSNSVWEDNVKNKKGLVLVDFSAEWCGPCRMLEPVLKKACELSDFEHVHFVKADVDKNPSLANSHDVTAVPTLLLFKDGKVIHRHQGLVNEKGLKDLLSKSG